jgi:hypothetical protein
VGKHTIVTFMKGYDIHWASLNGLILVPVLYTLAMVISKCLILHLFLSIFTLGIERIITQAIAVIVIVHGTIGIFMLIFQCHPVSDTWKTIDRPNCLNTQDLFKYNCLPVVITDVMMLILPLHKIWTLKASKRLKMGVSFMLLLATM